MAKTTSKSKQAYYSNYKSGSKWASNRKKKLERQLKLQPNNAEQIKTAIGNISYRRCTPQGKTSWSATNIRLAKLFKYFSGQAKPELFSSNPKVQAAALSAKSDKVQCSKAQMEALSSKKVSFSIEARMHAKLQ